MNPLKALFMCILSCFLSQKDKRVVISRCKDLAILFGVCICINMYTTQAYITYHRFFIARKITCKLSSDIVNVLSLVS